MHAKSLLLSLHHSIIIILLLLITSSPSDGQENEQYTICNSSYRCGNIQNISLPFWGGDRFQECGLPGLELECVANHDPVIKIDDHSFHDLEEDICPDRFGNTSLNDARFQYGPDSRVIGLFYGCPFDVPSVWKKFTFSCNNTGNSSIGFYPDESFSSFWGPKYPSCVLKFGSLFLLCNRNLSSSKTKEVRRQYGSLAPKAYSYSDIRKMTIHCKRSLDKEGMEGPIKERALIYEFMPNGSLDQHIYCEDSKLGWEIALGIGRGLEYLHRGCNARILHFHIKPHNILLDEDFCPKISDFGLAKLCLQKESMVSMLEARGTIGYIAPKVFSRNFGGVSHKSDVYSYGMMVLEMIGGRRNYSAERSHHGEIYFPRWAYQRLVTDEDLNIQCITTKEEEEVAKKMILVGLWCIQTDPSQRPSMSEAIEMLEGDLETKAFHMFPLTIRRIIDDRFGEANKALYIFFFEFNT
ncbi:putative receptor-like protein kinase [Capsicum chinense]|nr:putative receptor-like protein kinase [Capsicum chinense]